jgi:hypothetical protein
MNMSLKKKIHSKLLFESEKKEESLILENRILTTQFSKLKECSNYDSLIEGIISKVNTFQDKNFSNKLIKESLFDILQSLFGEFDSDFWDTTKEKLGDWICDKLEFDGMVREKVIEEIKNTPNEEVSELFSNCGFLTDKVATGVLNGFNQNIGMSDMDIELGGKTGQTFKNTLQSVIGSDSFRNQVKNKMTGEICTELKKVSDKMDGKAEEIRNTIIG